MYSCLKSNQSSILHIVPMYALSLWFRLPFWGSTQCALLGNWSIWGQSWYPTSLVHPKPLIGCQQLCKPFPLCLMIALTNGHIPIWKQFTIICEGQNTFAFLVSGNRTSQRGFEVKWANPSEIIWYIFNCRKQSGYFRAISNRILVFLSDFYRKK